MNIYEVKRLIGSGNGGHNNKVAGCLYFQLGVTVCSSLKIRGKISILKKCLEYVSYGC